MTVRPSVAIAMLDIAAEALRVAGVQDLADYIAGLVHAVAEPADRTHLGHPKQRSAEATGAWGWEHVAMSEEEEEEGELSPPVGRAMDPPEVAAVAEAVRRLLARIDAGEISASMGMRYRIEGALAALETVSGESSSLLARLGLAENDPPRPHGWLE